MFPKIQLDTRPGPLLQAWNALIRAIQKRISATYVHNTTVATITRGTVVRYTGGVREVAPANCTAVASSVATARAQGVVVEDIAPGAWGVMRTDDKTWCLFEAGLMVAPVAGDPVYGSGTTVGRATNVLPAGPGMWITKIGTVANGGTYVTAGGCFIEQKYCCEPGAPRG